MKIRSWQRSRLKFVAARGFGGEWGVIAIEYALLLPVVLVIVLGIIDAGRAIWTQATLDSAAEAAARCGAIDAIKCGTTADIKAYAVDRAGGMVLQPTVFTVTSAACGNKVTASLALGLTLPWNGSSSITLKSMACFPVQTP